MQIIEKRTEVHGERVKTILNKCKQMQILLAMLLVMVVAACKESSAPREYAAMVTTITGLVEITGEGAQEEATRMLTFHEVGKPPARFKQGELLATDENSNADLTFVGNIQVRVGSESKLRLSGSKLLGGEAFEEIVFDLNQGVFAYKSDKLPASSSLVVKTPTAVASVRGTEFLLRYENGQTELLVQSGSVAIGPPGEEPETIVAPDQKAVVGADRQVAVVAQTEAERLNVERFLAGLGDPNRKQLDLERSFESAEAIRAHYGEIHTVTLQGGRQYTGYVARHGDLTKVHTAYGVIEIPESDIETITEVQ